MGQLQQRDAKRPYVGTRVVAAATAVRVVNQHTVITAALHTGCRPAAPLPCHLRLQCLQPHPPAPTSTAPLSSLAHDLGSRAPTAPPMLHSWSNLRSAAALASTHPWLCSMTSGAIQQGVPTNVLRDIMRLPQEPPRCTGGGMNGTVSSRSGWPGLCVAVSDCVSPASQVAGAHADANNQPQPNPPVNPTPKPLTSSVAATPKSASSTWPLLSSRMLPACNDG